MGEALTDTQTMVCAKDTIFCAVMTVVPVVVKMVCITQTVVP